MNEGFLTPVRSVPSVNDLVIMGAESVGSAGAVFTTTTSSPFSGNSTPTPSTLPLPGGGVQKNNTTPNNVLEQLSKVAETDPEQFQQMVQKVQAFLDIKKNKDLIDSLLSSGNYILDPLKKELLVVIEHNGDYIKYVVIQQEELDYYNLQSSGSRCVVDSHLGFEKHLLHVYNNTINHIISPIESLGRSLNYPAFSEDINEVSNEQ